MKVSKDNEQTDIGIAMYSIYILLTTIFHHVSLGNEEYCPSNGILVDVGGHKYIYVRGKSNRPIGTLSGSACLPGLRL